MKAVVFEKVGQIEMREVAEPALREPTDALLRITRSAICGTDLHFLRGTLSGMKKKTILGHEAVGIVESVGAEVKEIRPGDRVVVCSTIACGKCERCRAQDYSQCAAANPNGEYAGTAFFGGPKNAGAFDGLQAERARIPYADTTLVKLPAEVTDDQAILISDIFPTAYFGAKLADVDMGKSVVVFGCGPVGLFAIVSAKLLGASRIFAVDTIPSRLAAARKLGAEVIDYQAKDPVKALKKATDNAGVDCAIDAVGVDANRPEWKGWLQRKEFRTQLNKAAPKTSPHGDNWHPGNAPTQVLHWATASLRGAGSLGIIGVYPPQIDAFPIGEAMNKNLSVKMGNCPHRRYIPELLELVRRGAVDPSEVISHKEPLVSAVDAYREFDRREDGWIKVALRPAASQTKVEESRGRRFNWPLALGVAAGVALVSLSASSRPAPKAQTV